MNTVNTRACYEKPRLEVRLLRTLPQALASSGKCQTPGNSHDNDGCGNMEDMQGATIRNHLRG